MLDVLSWGTDRSKKVLLAIIDRMDQLHLLKNNDSLLVDYNMFGYIDNILQMLDQTGLALSENS